MICILQSSKSQILESTNWSFFVKPQKLVPTKIINPHYYIDAYEILIFPSEIKSGKFTMWNNKNIFTLASFPVKLNYDVVNCIALSAWLLRSKFIRHSNKFIKNYLLAAFYLCNKYDNQLGLMNNQNMITRAGTHWDLTRARNKFRALV